MRLKGSGQNKFMVTGTPRGVWGTAVGVLTGDQRCRKGSYGRGRLGKGLA